MKFLKIKIRLFILYFYNRTTNYIISDLQERIVKCKNNKKELQNILNEILTIKEKYPSEPEISRAETIVKRLLVMKN